MTRCDHTDRVSLHPSIRIGGFAVGRCEREALPTMVVCAWHASPDAITMAMGRMQRNQGRRAKKGGAS